MKDYEVTNMMLNGDCDDCDRDPIRCLFTGVCEMQEDDPCDHCNRPICNGCPHCEED